jgi:hypothetical protein
MRLPSLDFVPHLTISYATDEQVETIASSADENSVPPGTHKSVLSFLCASGGLGILAGFA